MRKRHSRSLVLLVSTFLTGASGFCQSPPPADQTLRGTEGKFEYVRLVNGGLNLTIPILRIQGRGLDFTYNLNYSSKIWHINQYDEWAVCRNCYYWTFGEGWLRSSPAHPLRYPGDSSVVIDTCVTYPPGVPYAEAEIWANYNRIQRYPDGSEKLFPTMEIDPPYLFPGVPDSPPCIDPRTYASPFRVAYSSDLSAFTTEKYPDGSWSGSGVDANGNYVTREFVPFSGGIWNYRDSAGRTVLTEDDSLLSAYPTGLTKLTFAAGTINLNYVTMSVRTSFTGPAAAINCNPCSMRVLSGIDLPNGRSWKFDYSSDYGVLTKMTLPDGGYIRYTYAAQPQFAFEPVCCRADALVVTGRFESPDGVTEYPWSYSYTQTIVNSVVTERKATRVNPLGDSDIHFFKHLGGSEYYETDVEFRQGAQLLLS